MTLHFRSALIFAAPILALMVPFAAHAIEPSSTVKVTPLLKTTQTWNGAPIKYPEGQAEITGLMIEIAPGGETNWHEHPVPSFGVLLEGTLEVSLTDGRKKLIKPGEALAEVIATAHNGRNVGTTPVKLVVFYAGAVDKQLTVPRPDAKPKTN
ncbi:MAG TPA: cupin domain-containing protein [Steroidobacteraceae bacterium]|jgi:quercetin dioxygenase-like cupin family protein|nr:cupin domain-containing protein [Steroidobacteraceae bacterium]